MQEALGMVDRGAILAEIDEVLDRVGGCRAEPGTDLAASGSLATYPEGKMAALTACIERNSLQPSTIRQARTIMERAHGRATQRTVHALAGILLSVREDIQHGYGGTVNQRARRAVFDGLLAMASEIASDMHPAPAIVLAVSVLEDHIRALASARDISTTKPNGDGRKFEDILNDLVKSSNCQELWMRR
jgi:hypothetical protein